MRVLLLLLDCRNNLLLRLLDLLLRLLQSR